MLLVLHKRCLICIFWLPGFQRCGIRCDSYAFPTLHHDRPLFMRTTASDYVNTPQKQVCKMQCNWLNRISRLWAPMQSDSSACTFSVQVQCDLGHTKWIGSNRTAKKNLVFWTGMRYDSCLNHMRLPAPRQCEPRIKPSLFFAYTGQSNRIHFCIFFSKPGNSVLSPGAEVSPV